MFRIHVYVTNYHVPYYGQKSYKVEQIFIHPEYLESSYDNVAYDIAILKLEEKINFTSPSLYGKTDCVPRWNERNIFDSSRCIAMGWGIDEYGNSPRILQEIMLPMLHTRICQYYHPLCKMGTVIDSHH